MHMKRVLIAAADAHSRAWLRQAVEPLDVTVAECPAGDVSARFEEGGFDVALVEAGRSPEGVLQAAEHAMAGGAEFAVLAVVDPEAVASLRMPVRLASDFAVRGASSEELAARVRTLLWPGEEASQSDLVRIDDLSLNLATYQAYIGSEPIDFTYLEYALFAFLVTHPNRTYNRETLLRRVWGTDYFGGARTVDVHVRRVRAKLGPELARRLETVRNVGYLWNG